MPKDVKDLLIDLSSDPFLTEEFRNDPNSIMDTAGIDGSIREGLTSGDFNKLEARLTERNLMSARMSIQDAKKKKKGTKKKSTKKK